jgi:hypothetical protein
MNESKMKPIAMRCNEEQFNEIKPILIDNLFTVSSITPFEVDCLLVNNRFGTLGLVTNYEIGQGSSDEYGREYFDKWDKDTFLKYCGIKVKTKTKTTITAQELLEIHRIACHAWQTMIKDEYFPRIDFDQKVTFTMREINEMFEATTPSQKPILEKIFGKQVKPIEWDRIKTGSQVMLEYAGEHCINREYGLNDIDVSKPVDVIFYKTPHYIYDRGKFCIQGHHNLYCTFHQNGKYVLFSAETNTDYITKVVQY